MMRTKVTNTSPGTPEQLAKLHRCYACLQTKSWDEFVLRRGKRTAWRIKWCKSCSKEFNARWRSKNRSYSNQYRRTWTAYKKFGLTPERYNAMLEDQKGVCKICGGITKKFLAVDHCHKSNTVRGFLCSRCNVGIGQFLDSPELLEKAADYLRNSRK